MINLDKASNDTIDQAIESMQEHHFRSAEYDIDVTGSFNDDVEFKATSKADGCYWNDEEIGDIIRICAGLINRHDFHMAHGYYPDNQEDEDKDDYEARSNQGQLGNYELDGRFDATFSRY